MADLPVYRAVIAPDWTDYNGHLRDAYYALVASYAIDALMDDIGIDAQYRRRTACTLYTVEMHLHYLHEVKSSDDLQVQSVILDFDKKRIHVGCRFACTRVAGPVATAEIMLLHVHQAATPASSALPDAVLQTLGSYRTDEAQQESFGPRSRKIELKRR